MLVRLAVVALILAAKAIALWAAPTLERYSAPADAVLAVFALVLAAVPYSPVVDLPYVNPLN